MEVISVPPRAYPYLVAQRGAISDMREDRLKWLTLYANQLANEYRAIELYLPTRDLAGASILDVGGGCGGINILLNRHFGGDATVTILDGIADPPAVTKHSSTFGNFDVAKEFLAANGVQIVKGIDASTAPIVAREMYDLVISQKSWCFHYRPERYLPLVKSGMHAESVLIVDVRKDCPGWIDTLREHFPHHGTAYSGLKYSTEVFCGTR